MLPERAATPDDVPAQSLANHFSRPESASVASVKSPRALGKASQFMHVLLAGLEDVSKALSLISMRSQFRGQRQGGRQSLSALSSPALAANETDVTDVTGSSTVRAHCEVIGELLGRKAAEARSSPFRCPRVEACCAGNVGSGFHASSSLQIRSS